METAHGVEVGSKRITVPCLQLLDEALYIGGDDLFRCLSLLRFVWGSRLTGLTGLVAMVLMGCFLLLSICPLLSCRARHVATCRTPPGEGGVASAREGYRPPGGGAQRVIFLKEKLWGDPCAARGQRLSRLGFPIRARQRA